MQSTDHETGNHSPALEPWLGFFIICLLEVVQVKQALPYSEVVTGIFGV